MPAPSQILEGLTAITNDWRSLAVLWHVYFAVVAASLALGMRPSRKIMGAVLALPLLSVSALAWGAANPFNALVFAMVGLAMMALSMRLPGRIRIARSWLAVLGIAMFAFGWIYPHFLVTDSYSAYLYAAPTGLIPCPTLSIVIGLMLIANGLDSRACSALLGVTGLFYGVFGGIVLDVSIDWVLTIAAVAMLIAAYDLETCRPRTVER